MDSMSHDYASLRDARIEVIKSVTILQDLGLGEAGQEQQFYNQRSTNFPFEIKVRSIIAKLNLKTSWSDELIQEQYV